MMLRLRDSIHWPFCLLGRTKRVVVLGIRGTTTLSDALTDAVGEATKALRGLAWTHRSARSLHNLAPFWQVPECPGLHAHKAMLATCLRDLRNVAGQRMPVIPGQCTCCSGTHTAGSERSFQRESRFPRVPKGSQLTVCATGLRLPARLWPSSHGTQPRGWYGDTVRNPTQR